MRALSELIHPDKPPPADVRPYRPSAPDELEPSVGEVKQLWWFFDGSIMDVGTRHHLWRSWGFCCRHTWLYGLCEPEMRGGSLLGTAVLYEDLLSRAARTVAGWHLGEPVRGLRPQDSCFTCDYVSHAATADRADKLFVSHARRVRRWQRVRPLLSDLQDVWRRRSCPACLDGDGLPCRPHLLAGQITIPTDLGPELSRLRDRTAKFTRSQTWQPPRLTRLEKVAWVEALGFFAGWTVPDLLTRDSARTSVEPRAVRDRG